MNAIKTLLTCLFLAHLLLCPAYAQPMLKTAKGHPMQYYISIPKGLTTGSKLPVVILFEAAEKEYKKNIERFIVARGDGQFILVQPIHTNNGEQGRRDATLFPYSNETWDYIDKVGDCRFNADGIDAIFNEVRNEFHTQDRWYVTGFEAGTHMVWWMIFNRPDLLCAAAPVAGNYRSRCVDENAIVHPKSAIIIKNFVGDEDNLSKEGGVLYDQWLHARDLAKKNGHNDISEKAVQGKGHVTMEKEVMEFFASMGDTKQ